MVLKSHIAKNNIKQLKTWKKIGLLLLSVLLVWMIYLHFQVYSYPSDEKLNQRIKYLERVINEPLDRNSEIFSLGKESYEWMLFTYSFSSYALTNISTRDSSFKEGSIPIIKTAIDRVLDQPIQTPFNIDSEKLYSDSIPDYSVLYLGHLNLMLGNYRLLSNDTTYNALNDRISESLFRRFSNSKSMNLESYPYSIWIPDNTVALASLKLHSYNTGSSYDSICKNWIIQAKEKYLEPKTQTLYSTIDSRSGLAEEEPRGSMLGWSIMFIYQFDQDFADFLYQNYKDKFSTNLFTLRLFRERYDNWESSLGDIDSGPLFMGYSIPANGFALANSVAAKDYKTAAQLNRLVNLGTSRNFDYENEFSYDTRFIDFQISPMAEAIMLYSFTMHKWTD